jgi:hypothetical protein
VSVNIEWLKDDVSAIKAYALTFIGVYWWIKNGDRAGPFRGGGSVEHSEGKDGESAVAILRFLCGSLRLCRLRTEGLVSVSKY